MTDQDDESASSGVNGLAPLPLLEMGRQIRGAARAQLTEQVVAHYRANRTLADIAFDIGRSATYVGALLDEAGEPRRPRTAHNKGQRRDPAAEVADATGLAELRARPRGARLTGQRRKDVAAQLAKEYRAGVSANALKQLTGLAPATIRVLLLDEGVSLRRSNKQPDDSHDRAILAAAATQATVAEIAEQLDLHRNFVRMRLIELGLYEVTGGPDMVPVPPNNPRTKLPIVASDEQLRAQQEEIAARHKEGLPQLAPLPPHRELSTCERRRIAADAVARYNAGETIYLVAAALRCTESRARRLLLFGGVVFRHTGGGHPGSRGGRSPATRGWTLARSGHTLADIAGPAGAVGGGSTPTSSDS